jgi:chorismate synthase
VNMGVAPIFGEKKGDFARALLSLPAIARMGGSEHNDQFVPNAERKPAVGTATNRHGGMLGGITSGEPIVGRVATKPTSRLPRPQATVTPQDEPTEIRTRGRHEPCLLPRFVPMGAAMICAPSSITGCGIGRKSASADRR